MSFMYTLSSHTHILTYSYITEYKAFSYLATQTYLLESFLIRHKQIPVRGKAVFSKGENEN